ncbi:MAG: HD domain-containing protein [Elusimicrobia bacterium]|nr:HD domain-containing protein [Elusimicrobiota bacterium]
MTTAETGLRVPLMDMVLCLSHAVDLVSTSVADHHKRVAFAAVRLAEAFGLTPQERLDVLAAAALHDIGALSLKERLDTLEFELDRPHEHGASGHLLLRGFAPFAPAAELIRCHHVPWERGKGMEFRGRPVPIGSHVLHLADRIDVLAAGKGDVLAAAPEIVRRIRAQAPDRFVPGLVEVFCEEARKEAFWLDLTSPSIDRALAAAGGECDLYLGPAALLDLSRLFGRIVDFRCRFTAVHSSCVAATARALAGPSGFSEDARHLLHVAGHLHDLGKLAVSAEILGNTKPLSEEQWRVIRRHPFQTFRILERIKGLEEVASWASQHHERLDGGGYPFHCRSKELSLGSRIVAVADVFSAMKEDRSYRPALKDPEALKVLAEQGRAGLLDGEVVALLRERHQDVEAARRQARDAARKEYDRFSLERAGTVGAGSRPVQGGSHD